VHPVHEALVRGRRGRRARSVRRAVRSGSSRGWLDERPVQVWPRHGGPCGRDVTSAGAPRLTACCVSASHTSIPPATRPYGAPRIYAELRAGGTRVGRKRVARVMRSVGLAGRCPKRFRRTTIRPTPPVTPPPDLVRREFRPSGPDRLWVADITYVHTWEGWLYLAVVLDASVGDWCVGRWQIICAPELATDALHMALRGRRRRRSN
jgi:transposase InsO family protein